MLDLERLDSLTQKLDLRWSVGRTNLSADQFECRVWRVRGLDKKGKSECKIFVGKSLDRSIKEAIKWLEVR